MKKRVIAAALCLLVALTASVVSFFVVRRTCETLCSRTMRVLSLSDSSLSGEAAALVEYYADTCGTLRFFLGRRDIDALQTAVENVSFYAGRRDTEQLRQALAALCVSLRVLSDGEIPKSENIF